MLQRAASNAYSWWWASHIRTKQSKWLEHNLHDMEEKVNSMLKIIDDDGDSFAKRAEMYYRKRPELVGHVEESFRAYRALAERYDHLSKELQSANRTIASIYPERVQYSIDDDIEDEESTEASRSSYDSEHAAIDLPYNPKPGIPRVPKPPEKGYFRSSSILRKAPLMNTDTCSAKFSATPTSGLSKSEAVEEVDKLHKEILALQTEKEFVKSLYERGCEKFLEIETQITEMQKRASGLQDEFGICAVIEDDEARTVMATTALRSCQETLNKLQEKQEQSADEAREEYFRLKDVDRKFESLRNEFISRQKLQQDFTAEAMDKDDKKEERQENAILGKKNEEEEQLDGNSKKPLTMMELAEKIDELVNKVVNLETEVISQTASVNLLKSETNVLHAHVQSLEDDKETLMENSDNLNKKLKELEEELSRVKNLNQNVETLNSNLQSHFTEATCNLDHLSGELQSVKMMEQEEENTASFNDEENPPTAGESPIEEEENQNKLIETLSPEQDLSEEVNASLDLEQQKMAAEEEKGQPDWTHLFLKGLEDRERVLLEEYTSVLRDYKEVRNKLSESEKKNRDNIYELAMQIRELKNVISSRDDEIKSLHQKPSTLERNPEEPHEIMNEATNSLFYNTPSPSLNQDMFSDEEIFRSVRKVGESPAISISSQIKGKESKLKVDQVGKITAVSATEERLRTDIDELLEENLEFWLRFSTSIHQIQKFQTTIHDLQVELVRMREVMKKQEGKTRQQIVQSDARPIYRHLREIQTELSLWLEHNAVLKDELQSRYSTLCNIQEEISRLSHGASGAEKAVLGEYQAAKFQGEILNMKRENNKSSDELQAGLNRVRGLRALVDKTVMKLDQELGISASKKDSSVVKNSISRARIPLRSFLFGVKLKKQKQSLFSCVNPALQKQYSDLAAGLPH